MNSGDLTITDSTVTINATDKGITVTDELTVEGNSKVTVVAGDEGLEGRYINLDRVEPLISLLVMTVLMPLSGRPRTALILQA